MYRVGNRSLVLNKQVPYGWKSLFWSQDLYHVDRDSFFPYIIPDRDEQIGVETILLTTAFPFLSFSKGTIFKNITQLSFLGYNW